MSKFVIENKKSLAISKVAIAVAIVNASLASSVMNAQEAKKPTEPALFEEVIVTTERRALSVQDIAGTVQALSADDLTELGVNTDFKNLQNVITGLHIANQEGKLEVFLRGIGSSDSDFASDPSVATHYNGVYLPRPRSIGPMFFDVERVEVNKGPQGTIRGRNATGGTINIISKKPSFNDVGGSIVLGAGNYNQRHVEGVFNWPVSETFAVRAAIYTETRDSYMTNAFAQTENIDARLGENNPQEERIQDAFGNSIEAPGSLDDQSIRLSALYEPNDQFSLYVLADKVKQEGSGVPGAFAGRSLSAGYDIDDLDNPYNQYFVNQGAMENDIEGISTVATYDFGEFAIEYNGSIRDYNFRNRNAAREWQVGLDYPGVRPLAESVILDNQQTNYGNFIQNETSKTTVHELRLFSTNIAWGSWSAGIFNMDEKYSNSSQDFHHGYFGDCGWSNPSEPTICGYLNGLSSENRNDDSTVKSTAVYADATFDMEDNWRLKLGIRRTKDEKIARESNANYRLIIPDSTLEAYGLERGDDGRIDPLEIIMASTGVELVDAGKRPSNIVPVGNSPAPEMLQYWLEGIESFGANDNIDDIIRFSQENDRPFEMFINSDYQRTDALGNVIPGSGNVVNTNSEYYTDFRVGVEHDTAAGSLVYGTISSGTRAGGINRQLPNFDEAYPWATESLLVYEAGAKTEFDIGGYPIRINAAAFYYDYKDKVIQGLVSECDISLSPPSEVEGGCSNNFVQNQNASGASLRGLEIDTDIKLDHGFRVRANLALLDSAFASDTVVLDTRQSGNVNANIGGNRLPNTSTGNLNFAISQNIDFGSGFISSVDWTLSANMRSSFYLTAFNSRGFDKAGNDIPLSQMTIDNNNGFLLGAGDSPANGNFLSDEVSGFAILNANAGINVGSQGQYRIEAWLSNITDKSYSTKAFVNDSVNIRFLNTPQMYGLRFKAEF